MTTAGWIFLVVAWALVGGFTLLCFKWTLEAGGGNQNFPTA